MRKTNKTYSVSRVEPRIPMEVAVHIAGHDKIPGVETTFTENVSSRGARVLSTRRWNSGDRLIFASLPGNFQALARVAYCHPVRGNDGFAVGLEFLRPSGQWVIPGAEEIRAAS